MYICKGTIAFDFNGVIHKYSQGWLDGSIYDGYNEEVVDCIKMLQTQGYAVAIVSTRDPGQIGAWIREHQLFKFCVLPYEAKFWSDVSVVGITNRKIAAKVYVDDRALRFYNGTQSLDLYDDIRRLL